MFDKHHHVHHHYNDSQLKHALDKIMSILTDLQAKAEATLAKVTSDTDINNAVAKVVNDQVATITDLRTQLAAAIANGNDPVALQKLSDTMDAILQSNTSNAAIVAAAVTAGTPAGIPAAPTSTPPANPVP